VRAGLIVSSIASSIFGAGSSASSSSNPIASWIGDTFTAIQNESSSAGIMGALQSLSSSHGSVSASTLTAQTTTAANNFALIAQNSVTNTSSFYAQIAAQNQSDQANQKLQQALDSLTKQQQMVSQQNTLPSVIYFSNGSTLDTNSHIMTMADGTQYDVTTGAKYVNPADILEMANGAYLNTSTHIMTMSDGTQINTITGLKILTTA
jgi:hypothetical protein